MKYLQLFLMAELVANIAVVEELVQQFTIRGLADSEQSLIPDILVQASLFSRADLVYLRGVVYALHFLLDLGLRDIRIASRDDVLA
jgi:hypothetical protein